MALRKNRSGARWKRAGAGALLCLLAHGVEAEEDKRVVRDAAEVVKEGDVAQWLKHYERERRDSWAKQGAGQPPAERPPPDARGNEPVPERRDP